MGDVKRKMIGTLQKINITEELVMKVAKEQFRSCNKGELQDQDKYVIGMWSNGACEALVDFNTLVGVFKEICFKCNTEDLVVDGMLKNIRG